ncbi:MAG: hypothetical protein EBR42_00375 [Betaproteobacteria bacterium]|nr:hypothetical protein [Betaproteobacteria bacterium]
MSKILSYKYVHFMTIHRLCLICWVLFQIHGHHAMANSDVLLDIVQHCVNPHTANYCQQCRAPRIDAACTVETACRKTTEVWASNPSFVAIRDIKMCGCPSTFVHGLVLPLQKITGVEDPLRPQDIWPYAWEIATARIEQASVALVVNPKNFRSQNQLHVHLLRLKPQAREHIRSLMSAHTDHLMDVWTVAGELASKQGLSDYGVLVTGHQGGGFQVVVTATSPEDAFTEYTCR